MSNLFIRNLKTSVELLETPNFIALLMLRKTAMNSSRFLTNLSSLFVVSLLFVGCQSETQLETSNNKVSPTGTTIAKLNVGPAGLSAEPLQPATGDAAATMFQSLSPEATGVDFANAVDYSHPQQYLFATVVTCGGVAIGDVDNDGWSDIFFTSGPKKNRLYRQISPLKFEDITDRAKLDSGDAWSAGATMADIDNDGDLDIYVCNFDTPNHLFINNGDGTFAEKAKQFGVDFVGAGHTPTFCDYDRDGDLDFYLMTYLYFDPRGKTYKEISGMVNGRPSILPGYEKYYGVTKLSLIHI